MAKAEQGLLFSEEECKELQSVILANYRDRVQKSINVFTDEEENEDLKVIEPVITKGKLQEDLLDVAEIETVNNEIKQKQHEQAVLEAQKAMNLPYFENPEGDNQMLLNYQHDYIKNGDINAWGKLLDLAYKVSLRWVWKWMKENHNCYLDKIAQEEKASIAMEYVLRRYKKNVGWYVEKNFIGALKGGVWHAMSYTSKIEEMTIVCEDVHLERAKKHQST